MVANLRGPRFFRHVVAGPLALRNFFPTSVRGLIAELITTSEKKHNAEVQIIIEGGLDYLPLFQKPPSSRQRAEELFSLHRLWDTEENCGVLIYILLAEHAVEIVVDRGIAKKVTPEVWQTICQGIVQGFAAGTPYRGLEDALTKITELLAIHVPKTAGSSDELPNTVTVLR